MSTPSPNSRIDIRISNPEKAQWQEFAESRGMTLTQMIKQSVRSHVADHQANHPPITTSGSLGI